MDAIERVRQAPCIDSTADAKQGSEINCGNASRDEYTHFNADEAKEVLDSLLQNKELETLVMNDNSNFGSLESCRALRELVRTSTTLKHLSLNNVRMNGEGPRLIVEGILSNSQSALEALSLGWNNLGFAFVNAVTDEVGEGTEQSTDQVNLLGSWRADVVKNVESWRALGKLVRTSTTLKHLCLGWTNMDREDLKFIVKGIQTNSQAGLETLDLMGNGKLSGSWKMSTYVREGTKQLTDLLSGKTRALATLNISQMNISAHEMESIGKALASNTTLINLTLGGPYGGMEFIKTPAWKIFFDSLKFNKYLQRLDILHLLHDENHGAILEDLMGIFHDNYTIREMPYLMENLEGERRSQLEGMLLRNERLGEYINTLQEQLEFMKPNIGRPLSMWLSFSRENDFAQKYGGYPSWLEREG